MWFYLIAIFGSVALALVTGDYWLASAVLFLALLFGKPRKYALSDYNVADGETIVIGPTNVVPQSEYIKRGKSNVINYVPPGEAWAIDKDGNVTRSVSDV